MREFTSLTTPSEESLLERLANPGTNIAGYQAAMHDLGASLAFHLLKSIDISIDLNISVVCTAEDADFLAKGFFDAFTSAGIDKSKLKLVCFWNGRFNATNSLDDHYDVAPIVKQYKETFSLADSILVVVKSIIASACVVKTNLSALIEETSPRRVFVAAPVMYKGADKRLAAEFPRSISDSFEYLTFAYDDQKSPDGKVVLPGIGGAVYERLGIHEPMKFVPELVKTRRRDLLVA